MSRLAAGDPPLSHREAAILSAIVEAARKATSSQLLRDADCALDLLTVLRCYPDVLHRYGENVDGDQRFYRLLLRWGIESKTYKQWRRCLLASTSPDAMPALALPTTPVTEAATPASSAATQQPPSVVTCQTLRGAATPVTSTTQHPPSVVTMQTLRSSLETAERAVGRRRRQARRRRRRAAAAGVAAAGDDAAAAARGRVHPAAAAALYAGGAYPPDDSVLSPAEDPARRARPDGGAPHGAALALAARRRAAPGATGAHRRRLRL